ncbi:MAG: hypothetical protein HY226_06200 [Candidatus Vogelbacteria bacterium]|nr:hypothetical protein [Candidatus Vogelbacteria bacterium]
MSKSGQNNYKGVNAQAWAAMSLFMQFIRDPQFVHIQLEGVGFDDFDLVFDSGKKIICESKDRKEKFSYPQLKLVLDKILTRGTLGEKDEILVICSSLNDELYSDIKNVKFFEKQEIKFKQKGYSDKHIVLLRRVNLWRVPPRFNEEVVFSLFAELINFWIPADEIIRCVHQILVQEIYKGSAQGRIYSRADMLKQIEQIKIEVQHRSDFFNNQERKRRQFSKLEKDVSKNGIKWGTGSVSAFSTRWDLMSFAIDRLKQRNDLNLKLWNDLWQLNRVYYFTFGIFSVFKNNLNTDENKKYVLLYINNYTKSIRGFYRSDFFDVDVVKIVTTIIEGDDGTRYLNDAFSIVRDLITFSVNEYFYAKNTGYDERKWEKEEICKLLSNIYDRSNEPLKNKIFHLLISAFNITEDDSEFSDHTPRAVYYIINKWLSEDFARRFPQIVKIIADQYDRYYRQFSKKISFIGWEHMGGGISFSGNHHMSDRHFIHYILSPAIRKYYESDQVKGWDFIKRCCIVKTSRVSKQRPDFLNRSVLQLVISRYASEDGGVSKEAFGILKEYILARKGIPHKSDLVFQSIVGYEMTDEKKWKLVKLSTDKYELPVNPFAQQIVTQLAKNGHMQAKAEFARWFQNPKFYESFLFDMNVSRSIRQLLDTDIDFAIELTKKLVVSEHIKNEGDDRFGAFDIAELVQQILQKDYSKGLSILRILEDEPILSKGQQIIYAYGTHNHHGNDESDDLDLLLKVYTEVIDPFLNKYHNSNKEICERLPQNGCREAYVQFAVRLAQKKKISEAVRIIKIFIDDPHPYLPGLDPNDPKVEYSDHRRIENGEEPHTITSVRGWCGWALMKCSILDGRQQIPELIALTKKLSKDPNYYVVHMSCFSLSQLARNRLTVLPSDPDRLFFNDDKETALRMSKEVEGIAFDLLRELAIWPQLVQKAMAKSILHLFEYIRGLNEQQSLELAVLITGLHKEALKEAAPFLIYLAEFRKRAFIKWKFSAPGLYDDLGPDHYDASKFEKIILDTIDQLSKDDPDDCFPIASSAEHAMRELASSDAERKQYKNLALKYFDLVTKKYGHRIFTLIYGVIEKELATTNEFSERWFQLFLKCLAIEAKFYEDSRASGNFEKIRWYPSLYHSKILELVNKAFGPEKFIQAAKTFFSFPKELELYESDELVAIINDLAKKKNEDAMKIINILIERNPSKYWELRLK